MKDNKFTKKMKLGLYILTLTLGVIYFIINIKASFNKLNYIQEIINYSALLVILILVILAFLSNKKIKNLFSYLTVFATILLIGLNTAVSNNLVTLPTLAVTSNLKNTSLIDAMKWAKENKIELHTIYEYSDNIKEGYIIDQDILPQTILKDIKEINLTVSSGPNYEKELILSSMIGLNIDELLKFIEENHLNNVEINYEINNEIEKDTIISQSIKGQIKRKDSITFTLSLGNLESLTDIKLKNLVGTSLFDGTLYLKRNGIKYNLNYDFSDNVKRGYIMSQDINENEMVNSNTTINLTISKGKQIVVPDFSNKTIEEVLNWVVTNNLKVSFEENYHTTIQKGNLININYNKDDVIEEETKIIINTSKGALTVPNFNSLAEFLNWASMNGINYAQEYQYNNNVAKGNIISLSIATGSKIDPATDKIIVTISYGAPVTVPNFIGKNKSAILTTCKNIGLNCSFYYTGYSNTSFDTATTQNINIGSKVVSGTYIKIGLSNGPAKSYNVYIQDTWVLNQTADSAINTIRSNLNSLCPGVTFNFVKRPHTTPSGLIHPDSPVKGGNNTFVQGRTYTIIIVE